MVVANFGRTCLAVFSFMLIFNVYFFGSRAEIDENNKKALIWIENENVENDENLGVVSSDEENDDDGRLSGEIFQPSNEWQEVKPGQTIPRGLHVRLNLETGKKEAKLLQEESGQSHQESFKEDRKGINDEHKVYKMSELKRALKEFEISDNNLDLVNDKPTGKFRSYEELKRDFEQMNKKFKTDLEIITGLMVEYNLPNCTVRRKLEILSDYEYLTHQIDNAQNFADLGGFLIVKDALNNTDDNFREAGAFLLGSACQNNPKVQVAAVDHGLLHQILRIFTTEKEASVRRKYLFALSSILRHFPFAQKKFLDLGGLEVFENVFRQDNNDKEKLKLIALLHSLLVEKEEAEFRAAQSRNDAMVEKWRQYSEVRLVEVLVKSGFCDQFASLLRTADSYDTQEKILRTLNVTVDHCGMAFRKFYTELTELKRIYEDSLRTDTENDYINDLHTLVDDVISKLPGKDEL